MTDRSKSSRFLGIEAGRGVAAIMVVLHHAGAIVTEARFKGVAPFDFHLGNLNTGVDFFFILSGFIIAWIHWSDIGQPGRIRSFLEKRILRIYPAYWGILLPLVLIHLAFPQDVSPEKQNPLNILLSFVLLPNTVQPVLGVAWTLTHEMLFYLLFAMIIRLGKPALVLLPLWAVAILAAHFVSPLPFPFSFLLSPFNIEFIMGVGAAAILKRYTIPAPRLVMTVGILGFAGLVLFATRIQDDPLVGRLALGSFAMLFVLGCVEGERHAPFRIPRFAVGLGAASYAVYLIHPVILITAIQAVKRLHLLPHLSPNEAAVLIAMIATAAGVLYHHSFEKWLTALARRLLQKSEKNRIPSSRRRGLQP